MSYLSSYGSGYSSYSSGSSYRPSRSSYSSYSSSSYEPYSWRKTSASAYTSRTYDFGTSSFLSKSYGSSDHYSRKYDEYSWKAKDLLTDNPENNEVDVQLRESTREKYEFESVTESEDKEELVKAEESKSEDYSRKDSSKDYSRGGYSRYSREENTRGQIDLPKEKNDLLKNDLLKDKDNSRDKDSKADDTRDDSNDIFKRYYTKDYSRDNDDDTSDDSVLKGLYNKDYYKKYVGREKLPREDAKKHSLNDKLNEEDEKSSNSSGHDINMNYSNDKENKIFKRKDNDTSSLIKIDRKKIALPEKKIFDFEDDDVFIKSPTSKDDSNQPIKSTDRYPSIKPKPDNSVKKLENHSTEKPKSKSGSDVTDSGPLRMHRQGVAKFISAIPDQQRYVSSVNFLPDRIELRFIGVPYKQKEMKRCRSITDLYEITVKPEQDGKQKKRIHPWEETVQCKKQDMSYSYDSENEILYYTKSKHEHTKEMYISQYTHHFDTDEPRTHIAGWKCDFEPNGIPHQKSRMCVVRSPVVSGSRRRVPRPKSAPPQLFARPVSPEELIRSQKVDVVERGYNTLPLKGKQEDDFFFQTSIDESPTEDVSSIGYAPSDDTSDSSAFFFNDPRFHSRYENQYKDPDFGFNRPKLIRLSADFPGIRNLEKMRRKRQSMGSCSSGGSRSSVGQSPSPRNGEYGFFIAMTSGDPRKPQTKRQQRHSHYY